MVTKSAYQNTRTRSVLGAAISAAPFLTLAILLGPIIAGLLGTLLPAVGLLRPDGNNDLTRLPFDMALETPGLRTSVWLSIKTGLLSTLAALGFAILLVSGWYGTRWAARAEQLLSPLLSVPHAAAALGLMFLIAPSGWLARVISPWGTGWVRPPDLLIIQDPGGWALTLGLAAKELPFILLMLLAALPQARPAETLRVTQALGYGRVRGWIWTILPGLYSQIRLPIYAVLAYGMSNVDVALVLGPNTPPTLAVRILQGMSDAELSQRAPAAVLALIQLVLVIFTLGVWRLGERGAAWVGRKMLWRGTRSSGALDTTLRFVGLGCAGLAALSIFGGLLSHALWSIAGRWRFPDAWPQTLNLNTWSRHGADILDVSTLTLTLASIVALSAIALTIGCLESEHRSGRPMGLGGQIILYMPLLLPQITFLPGLQILLLRGGFNSGFIPVVISHLVFVLPYVYLALSGPYRAWDKRYATIGWTLGISSDRILWRIRLPMLLRSLLTAFAVGMAVSVGQYLPTLLASGGRVSTLTTEALALASGGDRRATGAWALALTAAAWGPFLLTLILPPLIYRNRKGVLHG